MRGSGSDFFSLGHLHGSGPKPEMMDLILRHSVPGDSDTVVAMPSRSVVAGPGQNVTDADLANDSTLVRFPAVDIPDTRKQARS